MCTVLLPPGGYTITVNKYIISYHIISYCSGVSDIYRMMADMYSRNMLQCVTQDWCIIPSWFCAVWHVASYTLNIIRLTELRMHTDRGPSWETASSSTNQAIPRNLFNTNFHHLVHNQWRAERGVWGVQTPPRNSEVLTKLSRIPSFVENTSVTV
jgi:hypothetical protein